MNRTDSLQALAPELGLTYQPGLNGLSALPRSVLAGVFDSRKLHELEMALQNPMLRGLANTFFSGTLAGQFLQMPCLILPSTSEHRKSQASNRFEMAGLFRTPLPCEVAIRRKTALDRFWGKLLRMRGISTGDSALDNEVAVQSEDRGAAEKLMAVDGFRCAVAALYGEPGNWRVSRESVRLSFLYTEGCAQTLIIPALRCMDQFTQSSLLALDRSA